MKPCCHKHWLHVGSYNLISNFNSIYEKIYWCKECGALKTKSEEGVSILIPKQNPPELPKE